jgi:hypothetical protein
MSSNSKSSIALGLTPLGDSLAAAVASIWPWSTASVEARRLRLDGHASGAVTDIYYLVSFDDSVPEAALAAIRRVGFSPREPASQRGFVTVRGRLRLGAYDLTVAGARLDRAVAQFGGFVTLIGAAQLSNEERARAAAPSSRRVAAI